MGGFVIRYNTSLEEEKERGGKPYHLTADDVIFLRERGILERLPDVSRDELCDKSKSDPLLKLIAICQILWSIIQISTRAIRRLPISLLELNVLALAACAIVIYGLCWYKPKHVQVAMTVLTYPGEIPPLVKKKLEAVEMSAAWVILFNTAREFKVIGNTYPPKGAPLSNTRIQLGDEKTGDEKSGHEEMSVGELDGVENLRGQQMQMGNERQRPSYDRPSSDRPSSERTGDVEMGSVSEWDEGGGRQWQ